MKVAIIGVAVAAAAGAGYFFYSKQANDMASGGEQNSIAAEAPANSGAEAPANSGAEAPANSGAEAPANSGAETSTKSEGETVGDVTELQKTDITIGEGAEAVAGKQVVVHYTGTLTNGTKFDSSKDRGQPFTFGLGAGQVIQGWDQGVAGMKVGGVRKLVIPPQLGYGAQGAGGVIPPNATLNFEVELLEVK